MEAIAKNKSLKTTKIIYWITTALLALFILSGSFFMNSKMAIDGMHHIGVPEWFRWELNIGHVIGGLLLILPVGKRLKEWTYVALGIDYISAFIALFSVDGAAPASFEPLVTMALLIVSYICYRKIKGWQF
jgi:hypothetical protein